MCWLFLAPPGSLASTSPDNLAADLKCVFPTRTTTTKPSYVWSSVCPEFLNLKERLKSALPSPTSVGRSAPPQRRGRDRERSRSSVSGSRASARSEAHTRRDPRGTKKEPSSSSQSSSPAEPEPPRGNGKRQAATASPATPIPGAAVTQYRVLNLEADTKERAAKLMIREYECREQEARLTQLKLD